ARREAQKLRFGQWLLNAINNGSYRGLRWIDSDHTVFRVPWKHNARKDITSSDLEVFEVGSMSVASSDEPHVPLPAPPGLGKGQWAWKTNFRCALSSTNLFKLVQDHSKRVDDPHKVF
ncbi:IRF3 factor, partial [Loxia leucoptera]|nr:IRF3 factor [Loxia leucoptera]